MGFDGFTDTIMQAVDRRLSAGEYIPIETIQKFGERILGSSGKSGNIELVPLEVRFGGNAPLLARALLPGNHRLCFAGTIGRPGHIEPLFAEFAEACEQVFPLGASGKTDALEFDDGKMLFGQMRSVVEVDYRCLIDQLPEDQFIQLLNHTDLFASVNWTMIPQMTDIWLQVAHKILPHLDASHPRWFFVDLADPAKRRPEELMAALRAIKNFNARFKVALGLNFSEAQHVFAALHGNAPFEGSKDVVKTLAEGIREGSGLAHIVVHARAFAVSSTEDGVFCVDGPLIKTPLLTTGGGDHFNAGYCHGLLFGLPPEQCLVIGVAASGFYVERAKTPAIRDICELLNRDEW